MSLFMYMVGEMWKWVEEEGSVYLVVERGDMPHLARDPNWAPGGEQEKPNSELKLFSSAEGAEHYRQYLIEHDGVRPSHLKCIKLSLVDVWSLLEELTEISLAERGAKLQIRLLISTETAGPIAHDVIYSQTALYN